MDAAVLPISAPPCRSPHAIPAPSPVAPDLIRGPAASLPGRSGTAHPTVTPFQNAIRPRIAAAFALGSG